MFNSIRKFVLKLIYKKLIFRTLFIEKDTIKYYSRLITFAEIKLQTNKGDIVFIFKHDRRVKRRLKDTIFLLKTFLVELKIPEHVKCKIIDIDKNVMVVVTVFPFNVDYEILAEVLAEAYCDKLLIEKK